MITAGQSLIFAGNVVVNGTTTINGTLWATIDAASATTAQIYFASSFILASTAELSINASVSVTVAAQANLDGTVYLANNAWLFLSGAGSRLATPIVTGTNATVQGAAGTFFLVLLFFYLLIFAFSCSNKYLQ
jgi:hypothetical protein